MPKICLAKNQGTELNLYPSDSFENSTLGRTRG